MLTPLQRNLLFGLFYFSTLMLLVVEIYIIYSMINRGVTVGKGISVALASGLLVGCGAMFRQMVKSSFLDREVLPMSRLHRLASGRSKISKAAREGVESIYDARCSLINETLRFAEETLQGWVQGPHFELCVFVDPTQPLLIGYFDSKHQTSARSMRERIKNPSFYIEKGYEVTKLLQNPTSQPRIIADTEKPSNGYIFTTPQQREQIRSSFLLCIDLDEPCALVISSSTKNAFLDPDEKLVTFIRYIGEQVRYDLFDDDFLRNIRQIKPEMFSDQRRKI